MAGNKQTTTHHFPVPGNIQTLNSSDTDDKIKEVKREYRWVMGILVGAPVIIGIAAFGYMISRIDSLSNKVDKLSDQTIRIDQKIQDMSPKV